MYSHVSSFSSVTDCISTTITLLNGKICPSYNILKNCPGICLTNYEEEPDNPHLNHTPQTKKTIHFASFLQISNVNQILQHILRLYYRIGNGK